jgi:hypothetical protein
VSVLGSEEKKIKKVVYLCGPMTGLPNWNHEAFHATEKRLHEIAGYDVISPAKFFSGDTTRSRVDYMRAAWEVLSCEVASVYCLEGWEKSKGATLEVMWAHELGLTLWGGEGRDPYQWLHEQGRLAFQDFPPTAQQAQQSQPSKFETILDEAKQVVYGDRIDAYGSPEDNFKTIGEFYSSYINARFKTSINLEPEDVAHLKVLFKVGRISTGQVKLDNYVDGAGYFECGARIVKQKLEREKKGA